jgi:hypothetical protein
MNANKGGIKAVVIVAVVVLAIIGGVFLALLGWAQSSGADLQQSFFTAVLSGDAKQVAALFHPALREEVDEPVLSIWMAALKAKVGAFKGLSKLDFATSTEIKNGVKTTQSAGKVNFEKGSARSELKYVDGLIVAFHVAVTDDTSEGWFHDLTPDQTQLYRDRGKEFLTFFLTDKPEDAFKMMHASLQEEAPLDKLKPMMASVAKELGAVKSVEYQSQEGEGVGKLKIFYKVSGEKSSTVASVRFQHEDMKYHLLAFKFNEKAPGSAEPAEKP